MAVFLSPVGGAAAQFFTNTGAVLTGGKLYTYLAGTTTPATTYTTSAGNVARTNPIVLDAAGRVPSSGEIWLTVGISYKFVLTDSNDALIGTYDNILGGVDAANVTYQPAGTGAVTTTVQAKLRQYVSVKDFGAVGDGATDDTTAVQAAFTACASSGQGLYFPAGTYNASSALTMGSHDLEMEGQLLYTGTSAITFLTVNVGNGGRRVVLNVQAQTTDWDDYNFVGVLMRGFHSTFYIRNISGFAIGARFGVNSPFAYNTVYPVFLSQNRIQMDLYNTDVGSYVNQNTFIGGTCSVFTNAALNVYTRIGVRITSAGTYYNNNNVFLNSCFELNRSAITGPDAKAIPIYSIYSQGNQFIGCRAEDASSDGVVWEENDSFTNYYGFLFTDSNYINYRGNYRSSLLEVARTVESVTGSAPVPIFDSGAMYERANLYDGSTTLSVDKLHFITSSSGTPLTNASNITLNSNSITIGGDRAIGTFIKTNGAREFYVEPSVLSGNTRILIACFDSSGARLTNTGGSHPYVVGSSTTGLFFDTDYGGVYRTSDAGALFFGVKSVLVATIQVLITGGTTAAELQAFKIYASNADPVAYPGVTSLLRREKIGSAVPSAGTWQVGDMVFNAAPTAGGTIGWVCVTAGTPGTWKTFGAITA